MSDTDQKESIQAELEGGENGLQKVSGLGTLLKNEREKKGLSQEQVVEVTRLRKHYVEALEDEDWDKLPPPVFVRGFIRSYAQVLGLREKEALELYESITPAKPSAPKPPVKPSKTKTGPLVLLIILLLVVAAGIYILLGYPLMRKAPVDTDAETAKMAIQQEQQIDTKSEDKPAGIVTDIEKSARPKPEAIEQPISEKITEKPGMEPTGTGEEEQQPTEEVPLGKKSEISGVQDASVAEQPQEPAVTPDRLVLTGIVKARTWIRICVDDQEPKEYIFQPGSRPQWKGAKGFNVLIGNAAGIEFDFDGKKFGNLGELGRVVRLRFPEDFVGMKCEE